MLVLFLLPCQQVQALKIWDEAPHNAFTDLIRHKEAFVCVFREGGAHVSEDGKIRVIASPDGAEWTSRALLSSPGADLRDPKVSVAPDGRLYLVAASANRPERHQTVVWHSRDGRTWDGPREIGEPDVWLWRVTWRRETAYGIGYGTKGDHFIRLYASADGLGFDPVVTRLLDAGEPNEASLIFDQDGGALALVRRERAPAVLGSARSPYKEWEWKELGVKIGGPNLIRLPDGRLIGAGRLYDGQVRTSLLRLDGEKPQEIVRLPSGGDTSYPGLLWHDELLWVSYYSSHQGKACIYLAKVRP